MPKPPRKPAAPRSKPKIATGQSDNSDNSQGERIAKVLARAGIASRRAAEAMILQGRVRVNGRIIDSPALNIGPKDRVIVDGAPLGAPEPPRLWLYHKPAGLVTSARDEKGRTTVFDTLPADMPRVMSVGRLDLNSEGLLLLTNDGELKRRLELPSTGWLRKYRVRLKGTPNDALFEPLRRGITIEGEHFQPMSVVLDRQQGANAWVTVGLREGRNREIRRAMEALGLQVNRLIRISYGPFQLGELAAGAVEELRPKVLRDQLGIAFDDTAPKAPRRNTAQNAAAPASAAPGKAKPRSWGQRSHGTAPGARHGDDMTTDGAAARKPRSWGRRSARDGLQPDGPGTPGGRGGRKPR